MKKIFVLLVALFLLVTACAGVRYTPAEIAVFPKDIQEKIRNSEVSIGMTRVQVRYAWGAPSDVLILDGDKEEWIYREAFSKITLIFSKDAVTEVLTKTPGEPKEAKKP